MPDSPRQLGLGKTIVYSLLPLLALCALLEGGARLREFFDPPLPVDYGLGFNPSSRVFRASGLFRDKMAVPEQKQASFNPEGFDRVKPDDEYRIFMIGGSNVNYLFPLMPIIEQVMETESNHRYKFNVIDVGGLAYGSQRMRIIADELLNYAPDMLWIYEANNEFEELEQLDLRKQDNPQLQSILYRSAFMRLLRDLVMQPRINALQRAHNEKIAGNVKVDWASAGTHHFTREEVDERMKRFEENYDHIIATYLARKIPVIIATVPSDLWKPELPQEKQQEAGQIQALYAAGKYQEGLALARAALRVSSRHQASDAENDIIRKLAKKHDIPLADVEARIIAAEPNGVPGEKMFSDRCHVTEDGKGMLLYTFAERTLALVNGSGAK